MKKVDLARWERYFAYRNKGLSAKEAARKNGTPSAATAFRFEMGDPSSTGLEAAALLGVNSVGGNVTIQPYTDEAIKALDDFAYFRLRYFGRKSMPWQERAAYEVLRLYETPEREYLVNNMPPGSGKSTLFTHDIPAWMTARQRDIRVMLGSETGRQARMYLGRLKRTFERDHPMKAGIDDLTNGIAFDAEATMAGEFGPFQPEGRADVWSASQITVRQLAGQSVDDKEPTVSAWGRDEKFLGGRFDLVVWDDLVGRKMSKEMFDSMIEWWLGEAETRPEPGGLLVLQGQRMWPDDLYRFCLDMKTAQETPKYHHSRYQAHDEERCTNQHDVDSPPWPDGCLLDPWRLPWRELQTHQLTDPRNYDLKYQQNDGRGGSRLVDPNWFSGGTDDDGNIAPGCYDPDRLLGQIDYDDLEGWSIVSVDPSPTKWWSVQWWIMRPEVHRYILVNKERRKMGAPEFLSLDLDTHEWSGVLHDLYRDSVDAGAPITHVVVEINAAQRYLLTQPHVQKWQSAFGVTLIPHQTHANKNDPKYGVTSLSDYFRQGKVRIPFGDGTTRLTIANYVSEFTKWPDARTDDEVMATWFAFKAIDGNYTPRNVERPKFDRPEWVGGYSGRGLTASKPRETPKMRLTRALREQEHADA